MLVFGRVSKTGPIWLVGAFYTFDPMRFITVKLTTIWGECVFRSILRKTPVRSIGYIKLRVTCRIQFIMSICGDVSMVILFGLLFFQLQDITMEVWNSFLGIFNFGFFALFLTRHMVFFSGCYPTFLSRGVILNHQLGDHSWNWWQRLSKGYVYIYVFG